jgi:hypothetical protein
MVPSRVAIISIISTEAAVNVRDRKVRRSSRARSVRCRYELAGHEQRQADHARRERRPDRDRRVRRRSRPTVLRP